MKKFKIKYKYLLKIVFLCTFISLSCNELYEQVNLESKLEYRDSLAVVQVVKTWQDSSFEYLSLRKESPFNLGEKKIHIIVLKGFYSPNRKKIVAWFAEKIPNNNNLQTDSGYYYFANCIIGVRSDTNKLFKFMLFEQQLCEAESIDWILDCLSKYFFQKMKTDMTRIYAKYYDPYYGGKLRSTENLNTEKSIYQEFGYNLQDKDFWDKSLIWYKGSRIKGYENDELMEWAGEPDLYNSDSDRVFKNYPQINYPDSILKLYPASYKELKESKKE